MNSETFSQGRAWAPPGSNPALSAVLVPPRSLKDGKLGRRAYLDLLEQRLQEDLRDVPRQEALGLLEAFQVRNVSELEQLRSLPLQEWPRFLLEESQTVQSSLWGSVPLEGWPLQVPLGNQPEAKKALEGPPGLRRWLMLALPQRRED